MSAFRFPANMLGKRRRDTDSQDDRPGNTLFVTGQTPTPAPEQRRTAAPSSWPSESSIIIDDSDDDLVLDDETEAEDEDEQQIYSQDQEAFPQVAAYSPRTVKVVTRTQELAVRLEQILRPHCVSSQDASTMALKAAEAQSKAGAKKQLIMLLGHTGTGKSSTTNSFVDDLGASKAAATGESCTCVPTLITASLDAQQKKYAAEIRIFDESARRAFLLDHVNNYNFYEFDKDESWPEEQEYDYRSRHETALKVLQALFCNQFEFESPGSIRQYLSARQRSLAPVVNTLEAWCKELLAEADNTGSQPLLRFDADTAEELDEALERHTFERAAFDGAAMWPLIEHVRKGIQGSRILRYVDFLDLPGTYDTNRVRAEFAHTFIRSSDALWTVTSIERPLSDAQLDRVLSSYANRFGNNVAIIATRSDSNIDDHLARGMKEKKQSVGEYWQQSDEIRQMAKEHSTLQRKINNLNMRNASKRQRNLGPVQMGTLYAQASQLSDALREKRNLQMDGLVEVRNSHIASRLKQDKKKHLEQGAELSVFCVSNTHYSAHKGAPSEDSRLMSVATTGIPALREHALQMAAKGEFHNTEEYVNKTLTLLKGAILWAEAGPTQQPAGIMDMAREPLALLDAIMEDFQETAAEKCDLSLINPLIKNRPKYESAAVAYKNTLDMVGGWHNATVRAFFGRNGNHRTPKHAPEVWNERFIDEQTAMVEGVWYLVLAKQKETLHNGLDKVIASLEDLPTQLSNSVEGTPVAIRPLQGLVSTCSNRIRTAYESRMEQLDKEMSNIKMDTTRDVPSGYFTIAMRDMYEACRGFRGKGCTQHMLDTLEKWLRGQSPQYGSFNSPFAAVSTSLQTEFSEAVTAVAQGLHRDITTILQDLAQHFERATRGQLGNVREMAVKVSIRPLMQELKGEVEDVERELQMVKGLYEGMNGE